MLALSFPAIFHLLASASNNRLTIRVNLMNSLEAVPHRMSILFFVNSDNAAIRRQLQ